MRILTDIYNGIDEPQLCGECNNINVCDPGFRVAYLMSYLEAQENHYGLCALFFKVAIASGVPMRPTVRFVRARSVITLGVDGPPVLSIVAALGEHVTSNFLHLIVA